MSIYERVLNYIYGPISPKTWEEMVDKGFDPPWPLEKWKPQWRPMKLAPRDGTIILALIHRERTMDMDDVSWPSHTEIREVFYRPYIAIGMDMPWHAGDPFDSGFAPDHFGEGLLIGWLPRDVLPRAMK